MINLKLVSRREGRSPREAAAYWVVRRDRNDIGAREESRFAAWLEDPVNAASYGKAQDALRVFDADADADVRLQALRRAALATLGQRRRERRAMLAASLIGVGVALTLAIANLDRLFPRQAAPPPMVSTIAPASPIGPVSTIAPAHTADPAVMPVVYSTRTGERRTVRLQDGSSIMLNTRTQIAVEYTSDRRQIHLVKGQALFDVQHDSTRPFSVDAAGRRTTALGTLFEVRVEANRVRVVLARGRVVVEQQGESGMSVATPIYLKPGEELRTDGDTAGCVVRVDVERALRWRDGFVEFNAEPLSSAVAEVNRYSTHPILLSDDGVSRLRISGVFRTGDSANFVDSLSKLLPIRVEPAGQRGIELSLAEPPKP